MRVWTWMVMAATALAALAPRAAGANAARPYTGAHATATTAAAARGARGGGGQRREGVRRAQPPCQNRHRRQGDDLRLRRRGEPGARVHRADRDVAGVQRARRRRRPLARRGGGGGGREA